MTLRYKRACAMSFILVPTGGRFLATQSHRPHSLLAGTYGPPPLATGAHSSHSLATNTPHPHAPTPSKLSTTPAGVEQNDVVISSSGCLLSGAWEAQAHQRMHSACRNKLPTIFLEAWVVTNGLAITLVALPHRSLHELGAIQSTKAHY